MQICYSILVFVMHIQSCKNGQLSGTSFQNWEPDELFQDCANRIKHAQHNGHNYFFSWEYELTKDLKVIDDDDDDDGDGDGDNFLLIDEKP